MSVLEKPYAVPEDIASLCSEPQACELCNRSNGTNIDAPDVSFITDINLGRIRVPLAQPQMILAKLSMIQSWQLMGLYALLQSLTLGVNFPILPLHPAEPSPRLRSGSSFKKCKKLLPHPWRHRVSNPKDCQPRNKMTCVHAISQMLRVTRGCS